MGASFWNETVLAYCAAHQIEFTRSRPYCMNGENADHFEPRDRSVLYVNDIK